MVRGDFTIREGIVKWIKARERSKVYLYLSLRVVNDIGGSVRRLEVTAVFNPLSDGGDHGLMATGDPGVSVAVLRGQAGARVQQLLVAGRALLLTAVTSLVIMNYFQALVPNAQSRSFKLF